MGHSSPIFRLRPRWQCPPEQACDSQVVHFPLHPTHFADRRHSSGSAFRESSSDRQPTTRILQSSSSSFLPVGIPYSNRQLRREPLSAIVQFLTSRENGEQKFITVKAILPAERQVGAIAECWRWSSEGNQRQAPFPALLLGRVSEFSERLNSACCRKNCHCHGWTVLHGVEPRSPLALVR